MPWVDIRSQLKEISTLFSVARLDLEGLLARSWLAVPFCSEASDYIRCDEGVIFASLLKCRLVHYVFHLIWETMQKRIVSLSNVSDLSLDLLLVVDSPVMWVFESSLFLKHHALRSCKPLLIHRVGLVSVH